MRQHLEDTFQVQVMRFLKLALDEHSFFFHVPNGGYRRINEAKRLKAMGVIAGVPDVGVINCGRIFWLELKAPKGTASDNQLYCHRLLRQAGSPVTLCKTLDEVVEAFSVAEVPLRTRLVL